MNSALLLLILLIYLGILFFIAHWAENKENSKWTNNSYIYSLSLAVYCTAWTYYGSIGVAANSGLNYLPIYIGPIIIIPAWIIILKKIIMTPTFYETILSLTKQTPNDMELGNALRRLIWKIETAEAADPNQLKINF